MYHQKLLSILKENHANLTMPKYAGKRRRTRRPHRSRRPGRKRSTQSVKRLALAAGETKIQKRSIEPAPITGMPLLVNAVTYGTPYIQDNFLTGQPNQFFNPNPTIGGNNIIDIATKTFIPQGTLEGNRIGRRVHMLRSSIKMVLTLIPIPLPAGPQTHYPNYPANPMIRLVHGWVKRGINALTTIATTNPTPYDDWDWTRYKILGDRLITLRAQQGAFHEPLDQAAPLGQTVLLPTFRPTKHTFSWTPNKRLMFSDPVTLPGPMEYLGYTPFFCIYNDSSGDYSVRVDYCKRVNLYKDL